MYTKIHVTLTTGGSVEFLDSEDETKKTAYSCEVGGAGELVIEKCVIDKNKVQEGVQDQGPRQMLEQLLTGNSHRIPGHDHNPDIIYAPGQWVMVEFE